MRVVLVSLVLGGSLGACTREPPTIEVRRLGVSTCSVSPGSGGLPCVPAAFAVARAAEVERANRARYELALARAGLAPIELSYRGRELSETDRRHAPFDVVVKRGGHRIVELGRGSRDACGNVATVWVPFRFARRGNKIVRVIEDVACVARSVVDVCCDNCAFCGGDAGGCALPGEWEDVVGYELPDAATYGGPVHIAWTEDRIELRWIDSARNVCAPHLPG